mmetsp:Transcript_10183/g.9865  ORF Transcript_10183/g.9865 Transcript_10183/m.9865 type:complete len:91 (+) Transcript_10183:745-1017(+)
MFRLVDPRTTHADRREIDKIVIHSGFKQMLEEKVYIKEGFSRVDEVHWSPVVPYSPNSSGNIPNSSRNISNGPLRKDADIAVKLFCSYLK